MAHDVFVSYSSAERERVRPFVVKLRELRLSVFFDADSIGAGQDWTQTIRNALPDSRCLLVFWTPQSAASENVVEEALNAKQRNVLIPVLLEATQLPYGLATASARDLRAWRGEFDQPEWVQVLKDVAAAARRPGLPEWGALKARVERGEDLAVSAAQLRAWLKTYADDPCAPDVTAFIATHAVSLTAAEEKHAAKIAAERHRLQVQEQRKLAEDVAAEKKRQRIAARSGLEKFLRRFWLPIGLVTLGVLVFAGFRISSVALDIKEALWAQSVAPRASMRPKPVRFTGIHPQFFAGGRYVIAGAFQKARIYNAKDGALVATLEEKFSAGDGPIAFPRYDAPLQVWDADAGQLINLPDAGRVISASGDMRYALVSKSYAQFHGENRALNLSDIAIFRADTRTVTAITDEISRERIVDRLQNFSGGMLGKWRVTTSFPSAYCDGRLFLPTPDGVRVLDLDTGTSPGYARTPDGVNVDHVSCESGPARVSEKLPGADTYTTRLVGPDGVTGEIAAATDMQTPVRAHREPNLFHYRGKAYTLRPARNAFKDDYMDTQTCGPFVMQRITARSVGVWRLDADAAPLVALLVHNGAANAEDFSPDCKLALTSSKGSAGYDTHIWRLPS